MEKQERDTYLMKLMLVLMRDRKARQAQVRNVGYLREYGELPDELGVYTLGNMPDEEILALAEQVGIKKRPAAGKSDVYMNELGYLFVAAKHPVVFVEGAEMQEVAALAKQLQVDELIRDITELTNAAEGMEQAVLCTRLNERVASELRPSWVKLISYWWCIGSAEAPSRFPAELVLSYGDPLNMNTWDIYEPAAYIESVWEHIELSFDHERRLTLVLPVTE